MIQSIQIKNFKSVVDLTLDLGTFNVLIGENGCGKSNIIEAVAFGAAANADKLDNEFLGSRGIRVTNPEFMYSAFTNGNKIKSIGLNFFNDDLKYCFELINEVDNKKKWIEKSADAYNELFGNVKTLQSNYESARISKSLKLPEFEIQLKKAVDKLMDFFQDNKSILVNKTISNYIVYCPEQSSLRQYEVSNQILPLGVKGEGLFQYLKELAFDKKSKKVLDEIKQTMALLDWYDGFDLGDNLIQNEYALKIKDKYLYEKLQYFDQRSTNEGFLYLLFYATLFISKDTPAFFAIDNIDASFNPKLCMQLTKTLAALAKKHKKQVIVTTQNPAILDGLNLKDDNQRLFVVRRNSEGHTKANRIDYKPERRMKLSEVWTNGFIGGLPENF